MNDANGKAGNPGVQTGMPVTKKKPKAQKSSQDPGEELLTKIRSALSRLESNMPGWVGKSGMVEIESLEKLLRLVANFVQAESDAVKDKFPDLDTTVLLWREKSSASLPIILPNPTEKSTQKATGFSANAPADGNLATPSPDSSSVEALSGRQTHAQSSKNESSSQSDVPTLLENLLEKQAKFQIACDGLTKMVSKLGELEVISKDVKKTIAKVEELEEFLPPRLELIRSKAEEWAKQADERDQAIDSKIQRTIGKVNDVATEMPLHRKSLDTLLYQTEHLKARLDRKIDLQDAVQVLELRQNLEPFIRAALIQTMSKQIMPVVEVLKNHVNSGDTALGDLVKDLETRCKQAGLFPLDKLFG